MVKIARLVNGEDVCGDIVNVAGIEQWGHLFSIRLIKQDNGKPGINFVPVVQFGEFNQSVIINDKLIVCSYAVDSEFTESFRHAVTQHQVALQKARQKNKLSIIQT